MPSRAYAPQVLLLSSVARYPSPLATHSVTTSGERCSSPPGGSSTPHDEHILLHKNSKQKQIHRNDAPQTLDVVLIFKDTQ